MELVMKYEYLDMTTNRLKRSDEDWHKVFQQKFEACIEDSREYKQYIRRMPYNMWDGKVPFNTDAEVAPMKAIHLTNDNLERLVRQQELIENLERDAEYGKRLHGMTYADAQIRKNNPAVAKAYEKYQMLLELARK
jgi:phosphatidylserine/phosphatidylglycerophosphate/cardiolipin synthase-like enzyme